MRCKACFLFEVLIIIFVIFAFSNVESTMVKFRGPHPVLDYYNLLYSDLVFIGVIEDIKFIKIPISDIVKRAPPELRDSKVKIGTVNFKILNVLKGKYVDPYININIEWDLTSLRTNYEVGDTLIMSPFHKKELLGGSYTIFSDNGRFLLKDGQWIHQDLLRNGEAFTLETIEKKLNPTKIANIIAQADLIITGTITNVEKTPIISPENEPGTLARVTISIDKLHKGRTDGKKEMEFRMIIGGPYWPIWRQKVPIIRKGHQYYVFLKKDEIGYYPFAGINGCFKTEGENLIYDNRTDYQYTKKVLDQMIIDRRGGHAVHN